MDKQLEYLYLWYRTFYDKNFFVHNNHEAYKILKSKWDYVMKGKPVPTLDEDSK